MDRRLIAASRLALTLCASDEDCMHQGPTKQGLTKAPTVCRILVCAIAALQMDCPALHELLEL